MSSDADALPSAGSRYSGQGRLGAPGTSGREGPRTCPPQLFSATAPGHSTLSVSVAGCSPRGKQGRLLLQATLRPAGHRTDPFLRHPWPRHGAGSWASPPHIPEPTTEFPRRLCPLLSPTLRHNLHLGREADTACSEHRPPSKPLQLQGDVKGQLGTSATSRDNGRPGLTRWHCTSPSPIPSRKGWAREDRCWEAGQSSQPLEGTPPTPNTGEGPFFCPQFPNSLWSQNLVFKWHSGVYPST